MRFERKSGQVGNFLRRSLAKLRMRIQAGTDCRAANCEIVKPGHSFFHPIDITLQAFTCDSNGCLPTGAPRVAHLGATYTGVGDTNTFRSNSKSTFGGCTMYFVGKGSSRNATASFTVESQSLDALGSLFTSTQKIKVLCH